MVACRVVLWACVWLNCVCVCVCYCVSVQCSCSRGVVCGCSNCCFRRAGSSVVELSIAARRVTGSNPVSRLLLLPCAPRNGPLSIACCLFLCSPSIPEWCEYTPRSRTNIPNTKPHQHKHNTTTVPTPSINPHEPALLPPPLSYSPSSSFGPQLKRTVEQEALLFGLCADYRTLLLHCSLVFDTLAPCCCFVIWSL